MNEHVTETKHGGLGQLASTAICGNDITSSCLYVSALAILYAGKWAPVSLIIVVVVLFLFRAIYAEVVGALPLNGGAYNALLNTTSKFRASIAACLTILSYMATAVISANEAAHYAHTLWSGLPLIGATIALLAVFMALTIVGITESATIAIVIFITHLHFLDEAYPEIDIEFVKVEGTFGPALIQDLSKQWQIPTNLMFIGSPSDHFMYGLADLGGVRLII